MIRKVLLLSMIISLPLLQLTAQEGPSLKEDLSAMASLYASGDYSAVTTYTDKIRNHLSGESPADPFFRDLALFLLWASRIETGDSAKVMTEMAYYFNNEGQTEFRSLPPLMSAFLYHDLLLDRGDNSGAQRIADSILAIPDYEGTIRIWADAGDMFDIVQFGSDPFLESLEARRTQLIPVDNGSVWAVETSEERPPADGKDGGTIIMQETVPIDRGGTETVMAAGGNFLIRKELPWYRVFWSHTFATDRQARDTGKALIRDGVISEFIVKQDAGTGRWLIQVGALKSEKTALEWEKKLESLSGGSR